MRRVRKLITSIRRRVNHRRVVQRTIRGVRYELDLSEVIRGGRTTLEQMRPLMVVEDGEAVERVGESLRELRNELVALEYEILALSDEDRPLSRQELIDLVQRQRTVDCLCCPQRRT